jgi:rRNA maturation RNase YbeY
MPIHIRNARKKHKIETRRLKQRLQRILENLRCANRELSVLIVGDAKIRQLNAQYRNQNKATDVLSFPQQEEGETRGGEHQTALLGDIVISGETARRQAREHQFTFEEELVLLSIHGILHLLGHDHEDSSAAAKRMRRKTQQLFRIIFPERKNITPNDFLG